MIILSSLATRFLETCQKPSNLAGCLGYVRGIHDFIRLTEDKKTFCFPEALTGQQTLDMLLEDLKTRPDERHYPIVNLYLSGADVGELQLQLRPPQGTFIARRLGDGGGVGRSAR